MLVDAVRSELAILGVASRAIRRDCPAITARMASVGGLVDLRLRDPAGRTGRKMVSDPVVAATVILSWARSDLAEPLLDERLAPVGARSIAPPTLTASAPPARDGRPALIVSARVERLFVSDSSQWRGLSAGACAVAGAFCVGGEVRVAEDDHFSNTGGVTEFARREAAVMATVDLPIAIGRASVVPGLGIGGGWLETARDESSADPGCSTSAMCSDPYPVYVGDDHRTRGIRPRFSARLSARVPLVAGLAIDAGASAEMSPVSRGELAYPETPDPRPGVPDDYFALPPEPRRSYRIGVGLSYGFQ